MLRNLLPRKPEPLLGKTSRRRARARKLEVSPKAEKRFVRNLTTAADFDWDEEDFEEQVEETKRRFLLFFFFTFSVMAPEVVQNAIQGFQELTGVSPVLKSVQSFIDARRVEGDALVTAAFDKHVSRVREVVLAAPADQKKAGIARAVEVFKSHIALIAADQAVKLNADILRTLQVAAGYDSYIWVTMRDDRVRATHRANEGKTFRWDAPPAETGHPGHDINCRCIPLPARTPVGGSGTVP